MKAVAGAVALTTTRFRAPPDVVDLLWSVLVAVMMEKGTSDQGQCVRHLVDGFKETYEAEHKARGGRHPVQERDSHCCMFPGCWCRVTEADHIRLKSRGGSDALWNLVPLCPLHHRIAKHLGMAMVWGRAPDHLYFQVGRRIWKDDRIVKEFETEDEAKAWAERHKRDHPPDP